MGPLLSVIVPAHLGGPYLERCLQAVADSLLAPHEVLVVCTGNPLQPAELARRYGFRLLHQNGPGPAAARNFGAAHANGDVLVFVDSDVEIRPDTLRLMAEALQVGADLDGIFGSYDAAPHHRNVCSLYLNLRHHFYHQRWGGLTGTFWAGCGALRRAAFEQIGGFGENFLCPSIEDIDLGMRLQASGHQVLLDPTLQVKHFKRWSLLSMLWSDVWRRAVPWTRVLVERGHLPAVLNLDWGSRFSAVLAWLSLAAGWAGSIWLAPLILSLIGLNAGLIRFFLRAAGPGKGLGCCALHLLYLIYSSLSFAVVGLLVGAGKLRASLLS